MGILKVKAGVQFLRIGAGGGRILQAVSARASLTSFDWILTCWNEAHGPLDPHTLGNAGDFSTKVFPNSSAIVAAREGLIRELGPGFTVLFECPETPDDPLLAAIAYVNKGATAEHFHIQPVKGTTYTPPTVLRA